jgi:hypothetical protein
LLTFLVNRVRRSFDALALAQDDRFLLLSLYHCGAECSNIRKINMRFFTIFFRYTGRDSFAFSPLAKIKVRLGQALGGGARPRRI